MAMDIETYQGLQLDQPAPTKVNDRSNYDISWSLDHPDDVYELCPEAATDASIPAGQYRKFKEWQSNETSIYPETLRDVSVYTSPGHDHGEDLMLLVCQDGAGYASRNGAVSVTQILDYLYHHESMPPMAAVFINPGRGVDTPATPLSPDYDERAIQRSLEYDTLSAAYGEFLLGEVLPFAEQTCGFTLSRDPHRRIACGMSSGGICAFSLAWFHPASFGNVISHCGSFTNIRGGHNYPYLVRTTPRKPIRVFMQSGAQDAQTLFGDWPTANMAMAKALEYAGYDIKFVYGKGGHTLKHGGALFADTLRWLLGD